MRFQITVRGEDNETLLREVALRDHRPVRDQAEFYVMRGLQEERARQKRRPKENAELESVA